MPPVTMRQDVTIYNETTCLLITSKRACGKYEAMDLEDAEVQKARRAGAFWLVELRQDDPITCRVLLNTPLSEEEEGEMVGVARWQLRVPDGKLVLAGGIEILSEGIDDEADEADDERPYQILRIPKGNYLLELYTCFAGINGPLFDWQHFDIDTGLFPVARQGMTGGPNSGEAVGAWFRRTRPGEPLPAWLRRHCQSRPSCDPGHESEYVNTENGGEEDGPPLVDFLLSLTSIEGGTPTLFAPPYNDEGVVPVPYPPRLPDQCPQGLLARGEESP